MFLSQIVFSDFFLRAFNPLSNSNNSKKLEINIRNPRDRKGNMLQPKYHCSRKWFLFSIRVHFYRYHIKKIHGVLQFSLFNIRKKRNQHTRVPIGWLCVRL